MRWIDIFKKNYIADRVTFVYNVKVVRCDNFKTFFYRIHVNASWKMEHGSAMARWFTPKPSYSKFMWISN